MRFIAFRIPTGICTVLRFDLDLRLESTSVIESSSEDNSVKVVPPPDEAIDIISSFLSLSLELVSGTAAGSGLKHNFVCFVGGNLVSGIFGMAGMRMFFRTGVAGAKKGSNDSGFDRIRWMWLIFIGLGWAIDGVVFHLFLDFNLAIIDVGLGVRSNVRLVQNRSFGRTENWNI